MRAGRLSMRILIRLTSDTPPDIAERVRRRLEFALGRFSSRVRSLSVRLTDVNGPRGGRDKQCQLDVRLLRPRRVIIIEDVDAEVEAAISRAADRATRAIARAVDTFSTTRSLGGPMRVRT